MLEGVIILGHGSRREEANEEFRALGSMLEKADSTGIAYATAFLSGGHPGLQQAVLDMLAAGITSIVVMPVFLTAGSHITEDIPAILQQTKNDHPELKIMLARHLGSHPGLVGIIQENIVRAGAALEERQGESL